MSKKNLRSLLPQGLLLLVVVQFSILLTACSSNKTPEPLPTLTEAQRQERKAANCQKPVKSVSLTDLIPGGMPGEEITVKVEVFEIGMPPSDPQNCAATIDYKAEAWTNAGWTIADKALMYAPNGSLVMVGTSYELPLANWLGKQLYPIQSRAAFLGQAKLVIGTNDIKIPVRNAGGVHVTIHPPGRRGSAGRPPTLIVAPEVITARLPGQRPDRPVWAKI